MKLKGVSHTRATALAKRSIMTVRDLLTTFPRRYIDMSRVVSITKASIGENVSIVVRLHKIEHKRPRKQLSITELTCVDDTSILIVSYFNMPWLATKLHEGDCIVISGRVEFNYGYKRMTNPLFDLAEDKGTARGKLIALHPASSQLSQQIMRRLVHAALDFAGHGIDPLPLHLREKYRLMSRNAALYAIHEPQNMDDVAEAKRRLLYEELLLLQLYLKQKAWHTRRSAKAYAHAGTGSLLEVFKTLLPFKLTAEQERACGEILEQMNLPIKMNHLLLGDVGSGKTVVAAHALLAALESNTQVLWMAPTDVLANQYKQSVGSFLDALGVSYAKLSSATLTAEKKTIIEEFKTGSLQVLFGTHALLEPSIASESIGLVVIDEEQRFGVEQREALSQKAPRADVLTLSATPIPRSLATTLYGDMTCSLINELPHNRAQRTTKLLEAREVGKAYEQARSELERGNQVFVVCPLVGVPKSEATDDKDIRQARDAKNHSESDISLKEDATQRQAGEEFYDIAIEELEECRLAPLTKAQDHARYLQEKIFPGYKVGLLHGKMPAQTKLEIMQDFREGTIDVLVSTTVVEVGIDIPQASVMIVQDAERFGLASLHQLRGRVGRSGIDSYVFLVSGSRNPHALERLQALERIDNGFELAEFDLSLRREGDILGNRQHGASSLKLVNIVRDRAIADVAARDAQAIIEEDPYLSSPKHKLLAHELTVLFG